MAFGSSWSMSSQRLPVRARLAGRGNEARPRVVEPCQVIGGGRQEHLDSHLRQPAPTEASHPALFLQDSEDGFDESLSSPVDGASGRAVEFLSHAPMLRMSGTMPHASTPIQSVGHVGVRHIGVDAGGGQGLPSSSPKRSRCRRLLSVAFPRSAARPPPPREAGLSEGRRVGSG